LAADLPYLSSYKNVAELFQRIAAAKQPENFTQKYLAETLGLSSSGDRELISLLKALGFLDQAGRPTPEYGSLKNGALAPGAVATAIERAYAGLYAANESAHALGSAELKGLVAQVAGSDTGMTGKIAGTFAALCRVADFAKKATAVQPPQLPEMPAEVPQVQAHDKPGHFGALRPDFHYNIQVHLPANATEETYLNIFNALRKAFRP
jgi:hypothetical protein